MNPQKLFIYLFIYHILYVVYLLIYFSLGRSRWVSHLKSRSPHKYSVGTPALDNDFSQKMTNPMNNIKGLVHPKMKISPCFTHPQDNLGVYDFLLSDKFNRSYIKNCPGSFKLYNGSGRVFFSTVQKKSNKAHPSIIKCASNGSGGWIKTSCSESIRFCKKNIHI